MTLEVAQLSLGEEEAANFVMQLSAHLGGYNIAADDGCWGLGARLLGAQLLG